MNYKSITNKGVDSKKSNNLFLLTFLLSTSVFFLFPTIGIFGFLISFIGWILIFIVSGFILDYSNKDIKNSRNLDDNAKVMMSRSSRSKAQIPEFAELVKNVGELEAQVFQVKNALEGIKNVQISSTKVITKNEIVEGMEPEFVPAKVYLSVKDYLYNQEPIPSTDLGVHIYDDSIELDKILYGFGRCMELDIEGKHNTYIDKRELLKNTMLKIYQLNSLKSYNESARQLSVKILYLLRDYLEQNPSKRPIKSSKGLFPRGEQSSKRKKFNT